MRIYTANYSCKSLPKDALLVSISRSTPEWFKVYNPELVYYPKLRPSQSLYSEYKYNKTVSNEDYVRRYRAETLLPLTREDVVAELEAMAVGNGKTTIVLLCYCSDFCHRHLAGVWLQRDVVEIS